MKRIAFNYLKSLNKKIKSKNSATSEKAYQKLFEIESFIECPGKLMYISYLKGKYHYLLSKKHDELENLYKSHKYFKKVFKIARKHKKVKVKNPKYFFKYAETAYRLSQIVWCLREANRLTSLADKIATQRLTIDPENSSFKWLKQQLKA